MHHTPNTKQVEMTNDVPYLCKFIPNQSDLSMGNNTHHSHYYQVLVATHKLVVAVG